MIVDILVRLVAVSQLAELPAQTGPSDLPGEDDNLATISPNPVSALARQKQSLLQISVHLHCFQLPHRRTAPVEQARGNCQDQCGK